MLGTGVNVAVGSGVSVGVAVGSVVAVAVGNGVSVGAIVAVAGTLVSVGTVAAGLGVELPQAVSRPVNITHRTRLKRIRLDKITSLGWDCYWLSRPND
jgi:hypothetical protein